MAEAETPKERAIEVAKALYSEGRIDEYDLETRVGYLESKPDDWEPASEEAVDAQRERLGRRANVKDEEDE